MENCYLESVLEDEYVAIILGGSIVSPPDSMSSSDEVLSIFRFHSSPNIGEAREYMKHLIDANYTNNEISRIGGYRLIKIKEENKYPSLVLEDLKS